jgi:hypothetical protein
MVLGLVIGTAHIGSKSIKGLTSVSIVRYNQLVVSKMPSIREISRLSFKVYCNLALLLLLHLPRLYAARLSQPVTLSSFQGLRPSLIVEWKMLNYTSTLILSYAA